MNEKNDQEKDWQPPWRLHLPVWLGAMFIGGLAFREISWWAGILIFLGIMTIYGATVGMIQERKKAEDQPKDEESEIHELRQQNAELLNELARIKKQDHAA